MEPLLETAYQCPKCLKAAFYLPGKPWDYKAGATINVPHTIRCKACSFPFTVGTLFLKNLRDASALPVAANG